jgi:hypothetical protein
VAAGKGDDDGRLANPYADQHMELFAVAAVPSEGTLRDVCNPSYMDMGNGSLLCCKLGRRHTTCMQPHGSESDLGAGTEQCHFI